MKGITPFLAKCLLLVLAAQICWAAEWEKLPDGSVGQVMEVQGAGGISIAGYIRKPNADGPFPVVILIHGGNSSKETTYALGRSVNPPTGYLVAAGWAVFALDFRPNPSGMMDPIEWEDTITAIAQVRGLPFIDGKLVALLGGSHGANVIARLASRVDARCGVLCAPAALDLPLIAKSAMRGQEVVGVLKKLIAEMEKKYGATAADIGKNRRQFGYESAYTEAAKVKFPLLLINGRNDTSSPVSVIEAYMVRVRMAGKPVEMFLPENGPHGFYFGHPDIPETKEAARRAVAFIRRTFNAGPPTSPAVPAGQPTPENRQQAEQAAAKRMEEYSKAHPPRTSTGMVPLTELGKDSYLGEQGGLYPGGGNEIPEAHLKAGIERARRVQPLDENSNPAVDGKIVLLTIGMSNTTMESQALIQLAKSDPDLNPKLVLVDGAQGGRVAMITADAEADYWRVADERLKAAGVCPAQVQVVWVKQANPNPTAAFPTEVKTLKWNLVDTLQNLHDRYPNLQLAYLSSRIYAGYAASPLNPEPHAYESGFAVKWVIAEQIGGHPELNYDASRGAVRAPWIAWGPYLWADGVKARGDGLVWLREDLGADGTHPAASGRMKVARLLLDFLKTGPTSRPWFIKASE